LVFHAEPPKLGATAEAIIAVLIVMAVSAMAEDITLTVTAARTQAFTVRLIVAGIT
jgi:hypothetical protein